MMLRQQLLKLAHTEPETRTALVPLLRENARPTKEEAEEVADLLLSAIRKTPSLKVKTASQIVDVRQDILQHPQATKQQIVQAIQKNPSLWGTVKKLVRNIAMNPNAIQLLKGLVSVVAVGALASAGTFWAIPVVSTAMAHLPSSFQTSPAAPQVDRAAQEKIIERMREEAARTQFSASKSV